MSISAKKKNQKNKEEKEKNAETKKDKVQIGWIKQCRHFP